MKRKSLNVQKLKRTFTNNIKFKPGYGLSDVNITPDSIFISGPDDEINTIINIQTKNINCQLNLNRTLAL